MKNEDDIIFQSLFECAVGIVTPLPEDDKYVTLRIDFTHRPRLIKAKIAQILDYLWARGGKDETRDRFVELDVQLQVWDLRCEKKPFREIGIKLYPGEKLERAENRVKQQFLAAWEKIIGEPYDHEKYKDLFRNKDLLPRTCKDCPDYDTCTILCPSVAAYVDSDYGSQKELTFSDEKTLDYLRLRFKTGGDGRKRPKTPAD